MTFIDDAPHCYINGAKGLYTTYPFRAFETILDYSINVEKYKLCLYENLPKEYIERKRFIGLNDKVCLIPDGEPKSKFFYIKHSNEPTCICDWENMYVYARNPLEAHTEVTIDYRLEPTANIILRKDWIW